MNRLETFASLSDLAKGMAEQLASILGESLAMDGQALIALSGGTTPEPVYRQLGKAPLDWNSVTVTLADERFVPPEATDSNAGLLGRSLFAGAADEARFLPLWSETDHPSEAAHQADQVLRSLVRPYDAVVLGMGADGHTASLFPGCPELKAGLDPDERRRCIAVAPCSPAPVQPRLTLTLPELLRSRRIFLLITGEAKRRVLETAMAGSDPVEMPVRAILRQTRVPVQIAWAPET
ncbi:MAG: 6-phosphogluconolactonase [Caulobacter sp.]|nr:6-phosphogluconolactonase [Caulobacter sp.]